MICCLDGSKKAHSSSLITRRINSVFFQEATLNHMKITVRIPLTKADQT